MSSKIISVCLLVFSITYLYLGRSLEFGSFAAPKNGFLPKLIGILAVVLTMINVIIEIRKPAEENAEFKKTNPKKALLFITGCLIYLVLLNYIGYLVATLIALFLLIKFTGIKGWVAPLLVSVGVSVSFFLIFSKLLSVPLPSPKAVADVLLFLE